MGSMPAHDGAKPWGAVGQATDPTDLETTGGCAGMSSTGKLALVE